MPSIVFGVSPEHYMAVSVVFARHTRAVYNNVFRCRSRDTVG